MKDRIKKYIEFKEISAGELAVMLDVQRSNISHILNGRNKPGAALIEKLLITFPDLNARWLLTGEGIMTEGIGNNSKTDQATPPIYKTKEKIEEAKEPESVRENKGASIPAIKSGDKVEKIILVYKDGTFSTYDNREKK